MAHATLATTRLQVTQILVQTRIQFPALLLQHCLTNHLLHLIITLIIHILHEIHNGLVRILLATALGLLFAGQIRPVLVSPVLLFLLGQFDQNLVGLDHNLTSICVNILIQIILDESIGLAGQIFHHQIKGSGRKLTLNLRSINGTDARNISVDGDETRVVVTDIKGESKMGVYLTPG